MSSNQPPKGERIFPTKIITYINPATVEILVRGKDYKVGGLVEAIIDLALSENRKNHKSSRERIH